MLLDACVGPPDIVRCVDRSAGSGGAASSRLCARAPHVLCLVWRETERGARSFSLSLSPLSASFCARRGGEGPVALFFSSPCARATAVAAAPVLWQRGGGGGERRGVCRAVHRALPAPEQACLPPPALALAQPHSRALTKHKHTARAFTHFPQRPLSALPRVLRARRAL